MRTIEFRGKRIDGEGWVYGYVDATMYKDIVVIHTETGTFGVDPETVGQFTGLYDKNGKEIYEGDVVKYNGSHWIYTIEFENFGFKLYRPDGYFYSPDKKDIIEVIGNIYKKNEQTQTIKQ